LLLVLDTNEYIFAFGLAKKLDCEKLILLLQEKYPFHIIRILRLIVEEVRKNLSPEIFKEFILFINKLTTIDEDIVVPFELAAKYESKGFQPEDAFICAYVEFVGADVLVTENRHFLSRQKDLPFRVTTAENISPDL